MSEQPHTFECPHCDYNAMSSDSDAIADAQFRHEDYHAMMTERAGETTVEQIAEGEIVDPVIVPTGTGIRVRLDRFTDYDNDGDEEGNYYRLSVDKPGCRQSRLKCDCPGASWRDTPTVIDTSADMAPARRWKF